MQWWCDAKFGLFIHFGLYAIPAESEWYMRNKHLSIAEYSKLAQRFNPTEFNADEWMKVAASAGMKYMAITSKHHDGFALFDSKASDYTIMKATPFKRDIIKELSIAAPKNGIQFGVYYSGMADWYHPGGGAGEPKWDPAQNGNTDDYIDNIAVQQVRELMNNYGSIGEVWFDNDGSKGMTPERANKIFAELKNQPNAVISPRLGKGDFAVQEQRITPLAPLSAYWEGALTMNGAWGYRSFPVKSLRWHLNSLIDVWSKGGNVLLNVGPDSLGRFPDDVVQRLQEIGDWMKVNGQAIYGSVAGPYDFLSWGKSTRKGNTIYLHVFNWPKDGVLRVPNLNTPTKSYLLTKRKKAIKYKVENNTLLLHLPLIAPDSIVSVIAVEVEKIPTTLHSLALNKPVTASHDNSGAKNAVDNNPDSKWKPGKVLECWLEVDLQTPQNVAAVRIGSSFAEIKKFALEYKENEEWKPIFTEANMPQNQYSKVFDAVKARLFRFHILEATGDLAPTSFELFAPE